MSASSMEDVLVHLGHKVEVAMYGNPPLSATIECLDCGEVLVAFDKEV